MAEGRDAGNGRSAVHIFALHHHALSAWARCRRNLPVAPVLLSLDFHTDVLCCARRGVPLPETGDFADDALVAEAVRTLRHDEHIDWAVRSGTIARAVVVSMMPGSPEHPAIEVRRAPSLPPTEVMLNSPETFRSTAEMLLDDDFLSPLLADGFPGETPCILDIDCDYLLCDAALRPKKSSLIRRLARRAEAITLSLEEEWVKILKLPGETLTGRRAAEKLIGLLCPERPRTADIPGSGIG